MDSAIPTPSFMTTSSEGNVYDDKPVPSSIPGVFYVSGTAMPRLGYPVGSFTNPAPVRAGSLHSVRCNVDTGLLTSLDPRGFLADTTLERDVVIDGHPFVLTSCRIRGLEVKNTAVILMGCLVEGPVTVTKGTLRVLSTVMEGPAPQVTSTGSSLQFSGCSFVVGLVSDGSLFSCDSRPVMSGGTVEVVNKNKAQSLFMSPHLRVAATSHGVVAVGPVDWV